MVKKMDAKKQDPEENIIEDIDPASEYETGENQ
jgi:hypothetical protein